jgi:phosphonate transport system substrate-binding protein
VVAVSARHGFPPLIAGRRLDDEDFVLIRRILLGMSSDPEGAGLLKRMSLDGFVAGDPKWYAEAARMMKVMGDI